MASQVHDGVTRQIVTNDGTLPGGHRQEVIVSGFNANLTVGMVDTELPAAAALAEGIANPTVPGVAAFLMSWNGFTWDRLRSPAGDAMAVAGMVSAAPMLFNGSGYDRQRVDGTG